MIRIVYDSELDSWFLNPDVVSSVDDLFCLTGLAVVVSPTILKQNLHISEFAFFL